MKPLATIALCGFLLLAGLPVAAEEECREVGPTHPDYPDYKATQCFITITARLLSVSVLGGERTVRISEDVGYPIPSPCNDDEGDAVAFTVNNEAVWGMVTDGYHHHPNRTAMLTFDVRRNVIRELESGNIDTRHTQCRGIVGASFSTDGS